MKEKRPSFRKPKSPAAYSSPEELFSKLPNQTHGYLRGPQADALRLYLNFKDETDIAFELPTGTGKTLVGLLVAEWRRRRFGERVAYVALTKQLAKQVLSEATKLGIDCADITGTKDSRDPLEVGRFKAGLTIGVTTYSNLFNVNPVLQGADVLVLDDAHGGEQYVADMWTVRIGARDLPEVYERAVKVIQPVLTEWQQRLVMEDPHAPVELAHLYPYPQLIEQLIGILDHIGEANVFFPWSVVRNHLHACLFLISGREIVIRPLVPPTSTHATFAGAKQRLFLSATLGGEGDLLRGYGITSIRTIRAENPQWGKRYIFLPGLYLEDWQCFELVADVWERMQTRRALLLAPSFAVGDAAYTALKNNMRPQPIQLRARDIEDSLEPFTSNRNVILSLAGRYDGLDLPGEDCRVLVMVESPAAIGALERHLREHWKMGPLLRQRERTRLVQGMGRCTRDATDFAVIILLGQSLVDTVTIPSMARNLPVEIQRELKWGIEQGDVVAQEEPWALTDMIVGLLSDAAYRREANESLEEVEVSSEGTDFSRFDESGKSEVKFSDALWAGDYSRAHEIARKAADLINTPEVSGYKAWWWYLGSIAAFYKKDPRNEFDCLRLARATRINSGFLDHLLRTRTEVKTTPQGSDLEDMHAEAIWNRIAEWGWLGPTFGKKLKEMTDGVATSTEATRFHIGLERLGECLGARAIRPTGKGVPDVIWIFHDCCLTLEAKAGKAADSPLSKSDVLEAKGHPDWVREHFPDLKVPIQPIVVARSSKLDQAASPHSEGLNYVSVDQISDLASIGARAFSEIRAHFSGKEYPAVREEFRAAIERAGIPYKQVKERFGHPVRAA